MFLKKLQITLNEEIEKLENLKIYQRKMDAKQNYSEKVKKILTKTKAYEYKLNKLNKLKKKHN